ncbi:hypothetical protein C8R44DRAFT_878953 [Mycena epipterygia]|nr:hypothetical protein C8R44DRAFT_878953 [Mycena epipterygia]
MKDGFRGRILLSQKAALVAQNPEAFDEMEELREEDRYHLRREISHKWHLPTPLYYIVFITSLGAAIHYVVTFRIYGTDAECLSGGWDNAGANGANLSFPEEFGIAESPWLVGCLNSASTLLGLLSAWMSDPLNDSLGVEDVFSYWTILVAEETSLAKSTYRRRIVELFTVSCLRRATLASFIVMATQEFSGIGIIAFYSSTIVAEAGYSAKASLTASVAFGAVNFIFGFPVLKTIEKFGRRNLLLSTFPNMAWCLFAAAACFKITETSELRLPAIAFFIFLFTELVRYPSQSPMESPDRDAGGTSPVVPTSYDADFLAIFSTPPSSIPTAQLSFGFSPTMNLLSENAPFADQYPLGKFDFSQENSMPGVQFAFLSGVESQRQGNLAVDEMARTSSKQASWEIFQ